MWVNTWLLVIVIGLPKAIGLLTPLEDPSASEKYSISYVTPEHWQKAVKENATALAEGYTLDIGDGLSCYVRQRKSNDTAGVKRRKDELELDRLLEDNLKRGAEIIINSKKECSIFMSGFWTYEYCPNIHLSQFHGNPQITQLYYVLGRPSKLDEEREFQLLYTNFDYYIREIVGSGDICDVTGNPRIVEIQYVCGAASDSATIQWIKEVKTCYYEVQIAVPQLCELELLSSNEEKRTSNQVMCVDQRGSSASVIDLVGKYEPKFVGSDFYLLEPNFGSNENQRNVLLYSGKHKLEDGFEKTDSEFYENIGSAFSRMLYQQLLVPSDGPAYRPGDEISWISDVVDLHGSPLTRLQFNLSSSTLANITLDSTIRFPRSGNLLYHRQSSLDDKIKKKFEAKSKISDVKSQIIDAENRGHGIQRKKIGDKVLDGSFRIILLDEANEPTRTLDISDAEDLFDHLFTPEQLETALLLENIHSLDDPLERSRILHEGNREIQHAFEALHDGPEQAGTTEIHSKEPMNKESQKDSDQREGGFDPEIYEKAKNVGTKQHHDSSSKDSNDVEDQKHFDIQNQRPENSRTEFPVSENSNIFDNSDEKEEASDDKPYESEKHLHDEL